MRVEAAELSLPLGRSGSGALSVHPESRDELEELLTPLGGRARTTALEADARVREVFDVVPRIWVKLGAAGVEPEALGRGRILRTPGEARSPARRALSQYWQLAPWVRAPLATLRRFLRMFGVEDSGAVETLIGPALEDPATAWYLVAKQRGSAVRPRIAWTVEAAALSGVLRRAADLGVVEPVTARSYRAAAAAAAPASPVHVSLDPPGAPPRLALDLAAVPLSALPIADPRFPPDFEFRYVKMRIRGPGRPVEWTGYMPLTDAPLAAASSATVPGTHGKRTLPLRFLCR